MLSFLEITLIVKITLIIEESMNFIFNKQSFHFEMDQKELVIEPRAPEGMYVRVFVMTRGITTGAQKRALAQATAQTCMTNGVLSYWGEVNKQFVLRSL